MSRTLFYPGLATEVRSAGPHDESDDPPEDSTDSAHAARSHDDRLALRADWNVTHIHDPRWSPRAKFHDAQTMVLAVLLGFAALACIWRLKKSSRSSLFTGLVFAGLHWVSQAFAFLFPGVAWTDPDLPEPGESLTDFPLQLKGGLVIFVVLALSAWLIGHATSDDRPPR